MNLSTFFNTYRRLFGPLKQEQVAPLEWLVQRLEAEPWPRQHLAYMLATVKHETADTFLPVREAYWLSEDWRRRNLRYWPWYGRGFVQLTWQRNYERAARELGLPRLATEPDEALEPEVAYQVMVAGMRQGWFTGKRLADYPGDYRNARRIINGLDKADLVASHARKFECCLEATNV